MTEEYKNKLLKWLTGQYQIEQGDNKQEFGTPSDTQNNFIDNFEALINNVSYDVIDIIQANGLNVMYGNYGETTLSGYILLIDDYFNIVELFTTEILEFLNVKENGEFYAITKVANSRYLKMYNNFVIETPTYPRTLVVIQQYSLSTFINELNTIVDVQKNPTNEEYLVLGKKIYAGLFDNPYASHIEIRQDTLEYTDYNSDIAISFIIQKTFVNWDNDLYFKITSLAQIPASPQRYAFKILESVDATKKIIDTQNPTYIVESNQMPSTITLNNFSYIAFFDNYNKLPEDQNFKIIKFENNIYTEIFNVALENGYKTTFKLLEDEVFIFYENQNSLSPQIELNMGKIQNNEVIVTNFGLWQNSFYSFGSMLIIKQNNLYTFNWQIDNILYRVQSIYNPNNYNGKCYQDLTSLNPNSIKLLDNKDELLFAKNSSSVLVQGNVTTSSFQIPNLSVNDVLIVKEQLIGKTNCLLTEKNNTYTKNIFEELIFNFINSINMVDNNDVNSPKLNFNGANRINLSTSKENDYNSAKMTKYRLNYADSNVVIMLPTPTINGLVANYKIALYNNNIISVDFISDDETTTYLTIDMSSYAINKYYAINQDMEVV